MNVKHDYVGQTLAIGIPLLFDMVGSGRRDEIVTFPTCDGK